MTSLISQAAVLQNKLNLPDDALAVLQDAMRTYAVDALNIAKPIIERRESPENVRRFMQQTGISYDGKSKEFK